MVGASEKRKEVHTCKSGRLEEDAEADGEGVVENEAELDSDDEAVRETCEGEADIGLVNDAEADPVADWEGVPVLLGLPVPVVLALPEPV